MDKINKNSFERLELEQIKRHGEPKSIVKDNIDSNLFLFRAIGETVELYTGKLLQSIIKMNS